MARKLARAAAARPALRFLAMTVMRALPIPATKRWISACMQLFPAAKAVLPQAIAMTAMTAQSMLAPAGSAPTPQKRTALLAMMDIIARPATRVPAELAPAWRAIARHIPINAIRVLAMKLMILARKRRKPIVPHVPTALIAMGMSRAITARASRVRRFLATIAICALLILAMRRKTSASLPTRRFPARKNGQSPVLVPTARITIATVLLTMLIRIVGSASMTATARTVTRAQRIRATQRRINARIRI